MHPYTVCLTSCGRFDLLERTLKSLLPILDGPCKRVLIVEDSGDHAVTDVVRQFDGWLAPIDTIVNNPPIGQTRSIDLLYAQCKTEWVFHCEDDWEFFSHDIVSRSFCILEEVPFASMVSPRDAGEFSDGYWLPENTSSSGVRYHLANPLAAGSFSGLLFSPGLRRMHDYWIVGPYEMLSVAPTERRVGQVYRELGYRVAILAEPAVRHIGDGRHVPNLTKPAGRLNTSIRSVRKRWEQLVWRICPGTDPVLQARVRQKGGIVLQRR